MAVMVNARLEDISTWPPQARELAAEIGPEVLTRDVPLLLDAVSCAGIAHVSGDDEGVHVDVDDRLGELFVLLAPLMADPEPPKLP